MRTTRKLTAMVVMVGLAALAAGAVTDTNLRPSTKPSVATYTLVNDDLEGSIFSEGCLGSNGGWYGCMCPIQFADDFTGTFTLTPVFRVPQGHRAFDVAIDDWVAVFGDDLVEVSGTGYYDTWTKRDGTAWHALTLDLHINGELVHFFSGVEPHEGMNGTFPDEVSIAAVSDTECWGYFIVIDADRDRPALQVDRSIALQTGDGESAE